MPGRLEPPDRARLLDPNPVPRVGGDRCRLGVGAGRRLFGGHPDRRFLRLADPLRGPCAAARDRHRFRAADRGGVSRSGRWPTPAPWLRPACSATRSRPRPGRAGAWRPGPMAPSGLRRWRSPPWSSRPRPIAGSGYGSWPARPARCCCSRAPGPAWSPWRSAFHARATPACAWRWPIWCAPARRP